MQRCLLIASVLCLVLIAPTAVTAEEPVFWPDAQSSEVAPEETQYTYESDAETGVETAHDQLGLEVEVSAENGLTYESDSRTGIQTARDHNGLEVEEVLPGEEALEVGRWVSVASDHFLFRYLEGHTYAQELNPDATLASLERLYDYATGKLGLAAEKMLTTSNGRLAVRIMPTDTEALAGAYGVLEPFGEGNEQVGWDGALVEINGSMRQDVTTEAHETFHAFQYGYHRDQADMAFFDEPLAVMVARDISQPISTVSGRSTITSVECTAVS